MDIVSPLLQWLNNHPQLAGLFTFIISAGESVAIIGTIVPGSIMMTAIGTLAGAGIIPLWPTIIWAILGAIVGDGISYWIGYYFKDRLHRVWPFKTHPNLLRTGEKFFDKYGSMSVFIGRFVGPVRALVPLVAGMMGMKPWKFLIANILSAIGWAPAYMLPGILLGAASLELPPDIAVHVILALFLIILFIMLCLWFAYKLLTLISSQIQQLQNKIWISLKNSRYFSPATVILRHHNPHKTYGQFNLALLFILASVAFLALAFYVKINNPANLVVNDVVFHLFRGMTIRGDTLDAIMLNITLLGQKQVLLPLVLVLSAWLVITKYKRTGLHALALGILTAGSIFVFKHAFKIPRPWGIAHNMETYSMPSGHAMLSATIFIGLALLIGTGVRSPRLRSFVYAIAIIIAIAVAISRLYLGAHWFTDIISSWLLSAAVLTFIIISYQRHAEKRIHPGTFFLVSLITLCLIFAFVHHRYFAQLKTNYTQINYPIIKLNMNAWWQKNRALPQYHTSLFGFRSSQINIEWVGNLDQIRETLLKEGWTKPPARDFASTIHRIADISSSEYLPLISPEYLDKRPALTLTRFAGNAKKLLVIRLWDSNCIIQETNESLWVGVVSVVPRSYSWLFRKNPGGLIIDPALVFPNKTGIGRWQWKILDLNNTINKKKVAYQKIMLIRKNKTIHKKK